MNNFYDKEEQEKRTELALNEFDAEQFRKDIGELNLLTNRILSSNPSCISKIKQESPDKETFRTMLRSTLHQSMNLLPTDKGQEDKLPKEIDDNGLNSCQRHLYPDTRFGNNYVGKELTKEIIEKSKEKITMEMPPIAKELFKLGLYGVYIVSEDKFNAAFMDFVISKDGENNDVSIRDIIDPDVTKYSSDLDRIEMPTLEIKLFTSVGRMKPRLIPLIDTRIEVGIKDFINDEFVKKVKEMCEKNVDDYGKSIPNHLKNPIILDGTKDNYVKVSNRISMISNFINVKNRFGPATFIYSSKKNIDFIIESFSGFWWKDGKTYKYNKTMENFKFDIVANDELGDTVIIGRTPKEGEVGINLVINKNTLTNFEYSDDDINGINVSFDFFAFGNHPEWNYFSFEMKR